MDIELVCVLNQMIELEVPDHFVRVLIERIEEELLLSGVLKSPNDQVSQLFKSKFCPEQVVRDAERVRLEDQAFLSDDATQFCPDLEAGENFVLEVFNCMFFALLWLIDELLEEVMIEAHIIEIVRVD